MWRGAAGGAGAHKEGGGGKKGSLVQPGNQVGSGVVVLGCVGGKVGGGRWVVRAGSVSVWCVRGGVVWVAAGKANN